MIPVALSRGPVAHLTLKLSSEPEPTSTVALPPRAGGEARQLQRLLRRAPPRALLVSKGLVSARNRVGNIESSACVVGLMPKGLETSLMCCSDALTQFNAERPERRKANSLLALCRRGTTIRISR